MRRRPSFVLAAVLVACTSASPPEVDDEEPPPEQSLPPTGNAAIDRLVARLGTDGLWQNGGYPRLELPSTATTEDVVGKVLEKVSFDAGRVKTHRIVETHRVAIGDSGFTAVYVDTDQGPKIVLLRRLGSRGWWSRVFDAQEPANGSPH